MKERINSQWQNGWLCGLVDGEGSFMLSAHKFNKMKNGIYFRPSFAITIHKKDRDILERTKNILNAGTIIRNSKTGHYLFQVNSNDGCLKVIDFFDKNFLFTTKKNDYELWKEAVFLIQQGGHRTFDGLMRILELREKMNAYTQSKRRISMDEIKQMIKEYSNVIEKKYYKKSKKIEFILKGYKNGRRVTNLEKLGLKIEFSNKKIMKDFIKFYKLFYPGIVFKIEKISGDINSKN